jgi:sec-independent protein translocase protein TatC
MTAGASGSRRRLSLAWLKAPPLPEDGNMTLFEHLKELRYRLVIASLSIIIAMAACLIFNKQLFNVLLQPYLRAVALAKKTRPDIVTDLVLSGVTQPFVVAFKIALLAGLVVSAPVWLYQIWAFIVPGLLAKEKKWSLIVVGAATPLFLGGVLLAYYVMPNGMAALIKFTPQGLGISNLQSLGEFLSFMTRVMLVFGVAFEIPLFILMLNIVGVLSAKTISKYRSYLIFAMFVFAAVATPSPDAITMLLLAIPMTVLVLISEILAHVFDRRKRKRNGGDGDIVFKDSLSEDKALAALSAEPTPEPPTNIDPPAKPRTLGQAFGLPDQKA